MSEKNQNLLFQIQIEPLLIDEKGAASLLNISRAHFLKLRSTGRINVARISLGRRKLYAVNDLKEWVNRGCKPS